MLHMLRTPCFQASDCRGREVEKRFGCGSRLNRRGYAGFEGNPFWHRFFKPLPFDALDWTIACRKHTASIPLASCHLVLGLFFSPLLLFFGSVHSWLEGPKNRPSPGAERYQEASGEALTEFTASTLGVWKLKGSFACRHPCFSPLVPIGILGGVLPVLPFVFWVWRLSSVRSFPPLDGILGGGGYVRWMKSRPGPSARTSRVGCSSPAPRTCPVGPLRAGGAGGSGGRR